MKSPKNLAEWAGVVVAILLAGTGLYKNMVQSQMITAENQKRINDVGKLIDGMMDRQLQIQERYYDHEQRLLLIEHEMEGGE